MTEYFFIASFVFGIRIVIHGNLKYQSKSKKSRQNFVLSNRLFLLCLPYVFFLPVFEMFVFLNPPNNGIALGLANVFFVIVGSFFSWSICVLMFRLRKINKLKV